MKKQFIFTLSFLLIGIMSLHAQLIAPDATKYKTSVSPLLKTIWGQSKPYNNLCPEKTNSSGVKEHCPVGCVALALGQIMKFYNYPEIGNGKKEYSPLLSKDTLRADFGATHYDWTHMRDSYLSILKNYTDEEVTAVATLLYHIGVSVGMIYDLSGSSAFAYGNIPRDLIDNFRYSTDSIKYLSRNNYTKEEWMNMIFNELSNGRPIFYAGNSPTQGGHAWVLDGYNANGQVHINFGWRGNGNDYYDIDLNTADTSNDFCNNQSMVIGIKPIRESSAVNPIPTPGTPQIIGIYNLNGVKLQEMQNGINIIRYTNGTCTKIFVNNNIN